MNVVGIRKINSNKGPIIEFWINIINTEPNIKMQIAVISKKFAYVSSIPRSTIDFNAKGYLTIFGGTAIAKVEERKSLPRNLKKLKGEIDISEHLFLSN